MAGMPSLQEMVAAEIARRTTPTITVRHVIVAPIYDNDRRIGRRVTAAYRWDGTCHVPDAVTDEDLRRHGHAIESVPVTDDAPALTADDAADGAPIGRKVMTGGLHIIRIIRRHMSPTVARCASRPPWPWPLAARRLGKMRA